MARALRQYYLQFMGTQTVYLAIFLLVLPLVCSAEQRSLARSIDPVEVSGSEVSDITNTDISGLRVLASHNGKLVPIPFQVDQKNADNDWVWSVILKSDEDSFQVRSLEDSTRDDQDPPGKDIFDANDVLLFIVKDAGEQDRKRAIQLGAERIVELEIEDPVDHGKGWVYLAYFATNAPALSDTRYVRYEPSSFRISGPEHEFIYSPDNIMVLEDFRLGGVSILTASRIRGAVTAGIGPLMFDFAFSEKTIQGYNAGYIEGPVRIIKRSVERIQLGAGITSPVMNCDHFHYPWHAEIPILISKQFPVRQVSIQATSIFRTSTLFMAEIDGGADPILLQGRSTNRNLLTNNQEAEWIKLSGEEISIISSVKIPQEHVGHLDVLPYLAKVDGEPNEDNVDRFSGTEAGFLIRTTAETPDGDHVVHSIFLFAANTNHSLQHTHDLLRRKLVSTPVTLVR